MDSAMANPAQSPAKATPITKRTLDNWMKAYAIFTDQTEAPREFHMWSSISAIAGALGRKCWIDMGTFTLYPSFYIIFVAPPGVATKSVTAGIAMDMLQSTKSTYLFQGSITWQAIIDQLQDQAVQITIGDQKLEMSSMQVFASELGVLLKKDDDSMVDMLVDLWDGKLKLERRTRGGGMISVARPFINLMGCTTPSWLSSYAEAYMIEGGFFSRAIFVYADKKEKLVAYPKGLIDIELKTALEDDLKKISQMKGEFTLTDEAIAWGEVWYENLWKNPPEHLTSDNLQSYKSRRQSHLHKVAMVLSAAESNSMVITMEHMATAEQILLLAEKHLSTIHDSIVTTEKLQAYKLVVKKVRGRKLITKPDLFKELASRLTYQEFQQGVDAAIFAGEIKQVQMGNVLALKAAKEIA